MKQMLDLLRKSRYSADSTSVAELETGQSDRPVEQWDGVARREEGISVIRFAILLLLLASGIRADAPSAQEVWRITCGLWRTDKGFTSTIQLKNRLVTSAVTVHPSLFMADGTEYELPEINLPAAGIAAIDVRAAISRAPASVRGHLSEYGSAALLYSVMQSALMAQMAMGSAAASESYVARFSAVVPGPVAQQTLEGLWWARDAGVGGFLSVSNATTEAQAIRLEAVDGMGRVAPPLTVSLGPHGTEVLDLAKVIGLQPSSGDAGGVRVLFSGRLGEVNAVGGLENTREGYSAVIPFWQAPTGPSWAKAPVTVAHPGIMVGTADPAMGFPAGTNFVPYLALRNLTGASVDVSLTVYTEQGISLQGPIQTLGPLESRQVEMGRVLDAVGMKAYRGSFTLALGHRGGPNDVLSAVGSADVGGTYVFEVEGRVAAAGLSKQCPYWSVKNGDNTMISVWNPSPVAQEVMVTLAYAGGTGVYHFVFACRHSAGRASTLRG